MNFENLCPGCMNDTQGEKICPLCGYDTETKNGADMLPAHFLLSNRFVVGRVLSVTCEGIIYLGYDKLNEMPVTVKEYFPHNVAHRNPDKTVFANEGDKFAFNDGLMCFMELAKQISEFELPSLFRVISCFEQNGTVYSVYTFLNGITLKSFIEKNGGSLKWEQARPLFLPLIDTVIELNRNGIILGNISPESIIVGRDGRMRIGDIMINRVCSCDHDLEAEVKAGYAAVEQYEAGGVPLGTYSDVYALSATLFKTLIGTVPPAAPDRVKKDTLAIPAHFAEELPRQVLVAIANGMQISSDLRTPTVEKFKDELVYGETKENIKAASRRRAEAAEKSQAKAEKSAPKEKTKSSKSGVKTGVIAALCTVGVALVLAAVLILTVFKGAVFGSKTENTSSNVDSKMPDVASIGEYDPNAVSSKHDYTVPDFRGRFLADIVEDEDSDELKHFKFLVGDKNFSESYQRGAIISQSVKEGTVVHEETVITFVISLGPQNFKLTNVVGKTEENAKIEILKQGLLYNNIEVVEKYDSDKKPGIVLEQSPESGEYVTQESKVRIYVNSYEGDEESKSSKRN